MNPTTPDPVGRTSAPDVAPSGSPDPAARGGFEAEGCDSFCRMSRRRLLGSVVGGGLGGLVGATTTTSAFGAAVRDTAFASAPGGNVVVVLSLRGGVDGLGLVVPHGDPGYYRARPRLAVPAASLVATDAMFGLHPGLTPLQWLFDAGELAAVHAVGLPVPNRSHFQAIEEIEDADPGSPERRGWVNRMIGETAAHPAHEAVHFSSSVAPTMLVGPEPTLALPRLGDARVVGMDDNEWGGRRAAQLRTVWSHAAGPLSGVGASVLSESRTLGPVAQATSEPAEGVVYPTDGPAVDLSNALADTARLIKADVGTRVVSIDYGSWDMHSNYGTVDWGSMQAMVGGLARSVSSFMRDLGPLRARVTLVTISEFGRRVTENGNWGLDHGWGNVMLVAGGGVKGGRYYGQWPGLDAATLVEGDVAVTTDYRDVLGEVVTRRLGSSVATVFPGHSYRPLGLVS